MLEADFRPRAGAQRLGALLGLKMPLESHGAAEPSPGEAARRTGEPVGRGWRWRGPVGHTGRL